MITLSPGVLHSAFRLLEMVRTRSHALSDLAQSDFNIAILPAADVVNFASGIGWLQSDPNGRAVLSAPGIEVYRLGTAARFRRTLLDYVQIVHPPWAQLARRGRAETLNVLSPEVWQCFAEAGLVTGSSEDVIWWWDALAIAARGRIAEQRLATGRIGERLTIRYEDRRTGRRPFWQALESNESGYDVLSVVNSTILDKLQIEVKTTVGQVSRGVFHVSRSQWETAQLAEHYIFHLWAVGHARPRLATITVPEMNLHSPEDRQLGNWELVEIPFSAFAERFEEVDLPHDSWMATPPA
jgi:hypothetical protein